MGLSVRNVTASIAETTTLNGINLDVEFGETAALIGAEGVGKSTLMRAIMGLVPVTGGQIYVGKHELTSLPPHTRASIAVGYMAQDRPLVPNFTVRENIVLPLWATGQTPDAHRFEWIFSLLPEIAGSAARKAVTLNPGQQKLVALARALICGSRLLLLDEPFAGVAPAVADRLAEVIAELRRQGVTVLLSASDDVRAAGLADRVFLMRGGMVTAYNPLAA